MAVRILRCAIEQILDWHPNLFVEPHVVALVAIAIQYSPSPARFVVRCSNIRSKRIGNVDEVRLEVFWHQDTAEKAQRMRSTVQTNVLVEMAAIALSLILFKRIVALLPLEVTAIGSRADYRCRKRRMVVEVSGTENIVEMDRRHREKIKQSLDNPFGWDAYVVVCAFAASGHQIRFSSHAQQEARRGDSKK